MKMPLKRVRQLNRMANTVSSLNAPVDESGSTEFMDLIEDQELRAKLNRYARDMAHAIAEYLNKLQATRQRRLESELQRVGKKKLT